MLDIGFSEILVIFVLALIVLGPEKLPRVAAQVGKMIGRARAMARQFREQLEEEVNVEATRKAQANTPAIQPVPLPSEQPAAAADSPTTAAQDATPDVNGQAHVDLTNEAWPHAGPVPPPEVSDVFGDMLGAPPPAASPQAPAAASPAPPPPATEAPSAAPAQTAEQVQWPHDHDIPPPSVETKSTTASPGGAASDTHEQGS